MRQDDSLAFDGPDASGEAGDLAAAAASAPLIERRADPYILRHADGYYYFTATLPQRDRIELRRAKTIEGLASAQMRSVWRRPAGIEWVGSPQLHCHRGEWTIHFAAAPADRPQDPGLYVIRNPGMNPLEGDWACAGRIALGRVTPCAAASLFTHGGQLYCIWSDGGALVLAPMATPWQLGGEPVRLAAVQSTVQAADPRPAVLKQGGRLFISHGSSGLLWTQEDANLLDPAAWQAGDDGPGPGSFTLAEDGATVLLVHDAAGGDGQRHTFVTPLAGTRWHNPGSPNS